MIDNPMKLMRHFDKVNKMHRKKTYVNMQKSYTKGEVPKGLYSTNMSVLDADRSLLKATLKLTEEVEGIDQFAGNLTVEEMFSLSNLVIGTRLFGTWRNTATIFRLDPSVSKQAMAAVIPDETPSDIYMNIPEWCVYMEIPESVDIKRHYSFVKPKDGGKEERRIIGFWAMHDIVKSNNGQLSTYLDLYFNFEHEESAINQDFNLSPIRLKISPNLTITESLEEVYQEISDDWKGSIALDDIKKILSLLLWVCVEEPDVTNIKGIKLSRDDLRKPRFVKSRETGAFVAPFQERYLDIAKRMGSEIREWDKEIEHAQNNSLPKRKIPHIRRGHWTGVWIGSGADKTYKTYWQKPIFVNAK